jgi:hypothetical protein
MHQFLLCQGALAAAAHAQGIYQGQKLVEEPVPQGDGRLRQLMLWPFLVFAPGAVIAVAGLLWACVELLSIVKPSPSVARLGPVLERVTLPTSTAMPPLSPTTVGRVVLKRTGDGCAIFQTRITFFRLPRYVGLITWSGGEAHVVGRWFLGHALVMAGLGLTFVVGAIASLTASAPSLGHALAALASVAVLAALERQQVRLARRQFREDLADLAVFLEGRAEGGPTGPTPAT